MQFAVGGKSLLYIRARDPSSGCHDRIAVSTFLIIFFTVSGDILRVQELSGFQTGVIVGTLTAESAVLTAAALSAVYDHAEIHVISAQRFSNMIRRLRQLIERRRQQEFRVIFSAEPAPGNDFVCDFHFPITF